MAWLLCLPVLALFVIAPPALGAFTAERNAAGAAAPSARRPATPLPATQDSMALDASKGPVVMPIGEFIGRAYDAQTGMTNAIAGVPVELTGFVVRNKKQDGWYLTRLQMSCCAGDAIPFQVLVKGLPMPREGKWVQVVGTWRERRGEQSSAQELRGRSVHPVRKPKNPYE